MWGAEADSVARRSVVDTIGCGEGWRVKSEEWNEESGGAEAEGSFLRNGNLEDFLYVLAPSY